MSSSDTDASDTPDDASDQEPGDHGALEATDGGTHVSFVQRLRQRYGGEVDPQISLQEHGEEGESARHRRSDESTGSSTSKGLWKKLADEPAAGPRYKVVKEIARGGMGTILRVWDDDLRRNLAMKVMLGDSVISEEAQASTVDQEKLGRFLEEAQITGQLDHPGVVPVHNLGLGEDGRVYFTMRLVRGRELKEVLDLAREGKDGWTRTKVLGLILKVCEAMAFAHSKGVVHRDLKPANVMVGRFGETYVMDWGLARVLGRKDSKDIRLQKVEDPSALSLVRTVRKDEALSNPDSPLVTMDGDVVGTPSFMAPEQAKGKLEEVGPHSDVFSMGAILYYMLTGRAPYVNPGERVSPHTVLNRVLQGPPTPVSKLAKDSPDELVAICSKAMARDPEERYGSMLEVADDIQAFLEGRVVNAYEGGAIAEFRKWVSRNLGMAIAITGIVLVVLSSAIGYAVLKTRQADKSLLQQQALTAAKEDADRNLEKARINAQQAKDSAEKANTARKLADESAELARSQEQRARRSGYRANVISAEFSLRLRDVLEAKNRLSSCDEDLRNWEWHHLDLRSSAAVRRFPSTGTALDMVRFHPDGQRILAVTRRGRLQILDAETGEVLGPRSIVVFSTPGLVRNPGAFDVRRDGTRVVFVGSGRGVRVFDLTDGKLIYSLPLTEGSVGHEAVVQAATYSPDGRLLASADKAGVILLWDAETGELVRRLLGHDEAVNALDWSPDSGQLASASTDDTVRIWDARSGETDFELRGHQADVTSLAWSRYGDWLASGSMDQTIVVWDAKTGALSKSSHVHSGAVLSIDFHPSEEVLVSAGEDLTLALWDLEADRHHMMLGHEKVVNSVAFSPDGGSIVSGSEDTSIFVWDAAGDPAVTGLSGPGGDIFSVDHHPNERWVAAGLTNGDIRVWDGESGEVQALLRGHDKFVPCLRFSPDGKTLASGSGDKTVRLWDVATWRELRKLGPFDKWVEGLAWAPDGSWIATGSGAGAVRTWDSATGELLHEMGDGSWVYDLAVDPTGEYIAKATGRSEIEILRVGVPKAVITLDGHEGRGVRDLEFSADGRHLFSVGTDKTVRVWDLATEEAIQVLRGHEGVVNALGVSPDQERLATASKDGTVRVWDARSGDSLVTLAHGEEVSDLVWSPDGSRLVTTARDGTALVWESGGVGERLAKRREAARVAQLAEPVVEDLFAEHFFLADVELHLRATSGLEEDVRAAALRQARVRGDDPDYLCELTRRDVLVAGATTEVYEKAVRRALAAVSLRRDDRELISVLGAAYYRAGQDAEAIERLRAALQGAKLVGAEEVIARAYLSMAEVRGGTRAEGQKQLDLARAVAGSLDPDPVWEDAIAEATEVLADSAGE